MRSVAVGLALTTAYAQWLPPTGHMSTSEQMRPTYSGEHCAFYDVRRTSVPGVQRQLPRLALLSQRPPTSPNASVCDGYGVRRNRVQVRCTACPGDPFKMDMWSVLLCAPRPLVPMAPTLGGTGGIGVLLISSEHNNHGLFAQVERVLNQLYLADSLGLLPYVYLGRKVAAAPWSCEVGENQYFDAAHGANVWEYYFNQVSGYALGGSVLHGRPVRLLLAPDADARRYAIRFARDAVTSYFEFNRYGPELHGIRTRVRRMGARLVRRWIRVQPDILRDVYTMLAPWRARATHLLGVHLRGTDKVTHPKIPLPKFFDYIDQYMAAHKGALILLATDDARYHGAMVARYADKVVSASTGYKTENVVRDPAIGRYQKGRSGLIDALLLAHCDFLLKGTSSLSEFALWYSPRLIDRHLDLQMSGDGANSPTYRALIPRWAGGAYEPPVDQPGEEPTAALAALRDAAFAAPSARASRGRRARGSARLRNKGRKRTRSEARQLRAVASEQEYFRRPGNNSVPVWPLPAVTRLSLHRSRLTPSPVAAQGASPPVKANGGGDGARQFTTGLQAVAIDSGSCADHGGLQPLNEVECATLEAKQGFHYIGRTDERSEPPGCMRWAGGFVEFNAHQSVDGQRRECANPDAQTDVQSRPGCLCKRA